MRSSWPKITPFFAVYRKDLAAFHERLEAIENQIAQEAGSDVPKEVEEIGELKRKHHLDG